MLEVDLTDLNQVKQIVNDIENQENRDRKRCEWINYQVYSGDQRKLVLAELKSMFPKSWKSMYVSNINIFKKVVNKIAKVYSKNQPIRQVGDNDLSDTYTFASAFKSLDSLYTRHKYCLGWVRNDPELPKEFDVKFLAPYLFDVVLDPDSNELVCVILSYPDKDLTSTSGTDQLNAIVAESPADSSSNEKRYAMWTADRHVNVRARTKEIGQQLVTEVDFMVDEANPQMVNPLGMLPFVWVTSEEDIPEYPAANSLPFESININLMNSDLLTGACRAAVPILKLKYPEGDKIKVVHEGHSVSMALPQSRDPDAPKADAEYINANPPLQSIKEVLFDYAAGVVGDSGIEGFSITSNNQSFQSGFDRALAQAGTTEVREENIITYQKAEQDIFEVMKAYDSANGSKMFGEKDELNIIYPKAKVLQSEKETLEIIEKKKELGLIEEWEKFLIINPNITEEQAREKLELITAESKERLDAFLQPQGTVDADNETED